MNTPLTLEKDQEISIKVGLTECFCFNDSKLSEQHYRTIPNDGNPQWFLYWANLPSVAIGTKGDYAVAVTMFEYVVMSARYNENYYKWYQEKGEAAEVPERGRMYIAKNPFFIDNGDHLNFRKIVWVRNSDLVLQSAADSEIDRTVAEKKQKDDLAKLLADDDKKKKDDEATAAAANNKKKSSTVWIILGIVIILIAGMWALISSAKKRQALAKIEETNNSSKVNIIRIPKDS